MQAANRDTMKQHFVTATESSHLLEANPLTSRSWREARVSLDWSNALHSRLPRKSSVQLHDLLSGHPKANGITCCCCSPGRIPTCVLENVQIIAARGMKLGGTCGNCAEMWQKLEGLNLHRWLVASQSRQLIRMFEVLYSKSHYSSYNALFLYWTYERSR